MDLVATERLQDPELSLRLHSLRRNLQAEVVAEVDDGSGERERLIALPELFHKRLVDLELIELEQL